MIFSKLFKEKWQSKKVELRLQAVEELDLNNTTDKSILIDLIENAPDKTVRSRALTKINQFSIWLNASNNNSHSDIRQLAQQKIENIVLGLDNITLNKEEKFSFLEQKPQAQLLEKWLFNEKNTNLQITLFELINKPQLAVKLFNECNDAKVQSYIVDQSDDITLLEKLLKKTQFSEVNNIISQKISEITEEQAKPIKLTKQAQLILAKFLALKDVSNYQEMLTKKEAICEQWQIITTDFDLLSKEQQNIFNEKWQSIETQLSKIFAIKAEAFQQQQIIEKLKQEKTQEFESFNTKFNEINQRLSTAIYENTPIDKNNFEQEIEQQLNAITQSVLDAKTQQQLTTLFNQERQKLALLDEIAESITQATYLISELSQVSLPQSIEQYVDKIAFYHDWQKQWTQVQTNSCQLLPESITSSYRLLTKQWQEIIKPFEKSLKEQFYQVKNNFSDVKRLINSGKFNVSFGVFKKAERSYLLLTEKQQQSLYKEYIWCQEKINELSDWENYIATPKKQALLLEIQSLAQQPLANPSEQAQKVKNSRKTWNALGHAQPEIDSELNEAFNLACEQAFAPCRQFYSEQEKLRKQNLQVREQLIIETEGLKNAIEHPPVDWKKLDSDLNKILQKWRNAGEVDKGLYHRLNKQFNLSLTPVKNAISAFHQDNIDKKNALIKQAEKITLQEDIVQASHDIKALQHQWRAIGYCGPKIENKLWKTFRGHNDEVFTKLKKSQEADNKLQNTKLDNLSQNVDELINKVPSNISVNQIKEFLQASAEINDQLVHLKPRSNGLLTQLVEFDKFLKQKQSVLIQEEKNKSWSLLFGVLQSSVEQGVEFTTAPNYNELPNKWKKRLKAIPNQSVSSEERKEKTIALELISGATPPESDKEITMKIQVGLMQQQLSNKVTVTPEDILTQWLSLGSLSHNDLPLLERIKPLFVQIH
ncbi:DUF349 domain-containing protein [Thalassotalea profundi]|uniref:DUF349 domain-containing protein n=1 Tax=Thalassotalea profundi TaxID=2036687 RepID=A0ABQ3ILC7_9GAMM|nr:DUF349 domain-containing protein [Thalassotalea profundi]GHE82659.1 hypothetical protein GCM10011501_08670 [Thalassotalea profundi]